MFAAAYAKATVFTRPVIISVAHFDNSCAAKIGSFVVINDEGWIITAAHIVNDLMASEKAKAEHSAYLVQVDQINQSKALLSDQKIKQIRKLGRRDPKSIIDYSPWWGQDGATLKDISILDDADIAVGRLDAFNAKPTAYPIFKDPQKPILSGTSLCRLGFPFHAVQPTYTTNPAAFKLPPGTFPMVFFPNEGIFTRVLALNQDPKNYIAFIETSSPGLPGQSGGPIFDQQGTVWGIQSHTSSIPLGFKGQVPGGPAGQVEHQFLNVGRGAHPSTIAQILNKVGIKHALSAY